jgi:hypothetical protein
VLIATQGRQRFFEDHGTNVKDIRRSPLAVSGYSVGLRQGRPHVRIAEPEYRGLKAYFTDIAVHRSADELCAKLSSLPFEPYAPVRRQYLSLLRHINRARKAAGLSEVRFSRLRLKRRIFRPFETEAVEEELLKTGTE